MFIKLNMRAPTPGLTLCNVTSFYNFLLNGYFDKSIVVLHFFIRLSMLVRYQNNRRSITISS